MATVVTWYGADLVTGRIVEELQDLTPSGELSRLLGAYSSASFSLPIPLGGHGAPPRNWQSATEPGRSMIVAVLGGRPIWGGIVLPRDRGSQATAPIACVSIEGYLDRRYVRDHAFVQQDEAVIATSLVGDANIEGISIIVDAPDTGTLRDRTYFDKDDATVYSRLQELSGVIGGPEWTIDIEWADSTETAFTKVFRLRPRIGVVSSQPTAVFTTGSTSAVLSSVGASGATYMLREDWSSRKGANHVVATSSGEGEDKPQSAPARDETLIAAGWPRYEHRFNAGSSIINIATLDAHAQRALELMRHGARTLSIVTRADAYPMLGTDWSIGDDIGFELQGHGHPDGLTGIARAVGWRLDAQAGTVSPVLLLPGQEETG